MDEKRRCIVALHAHPDDESSKGAGTMARYAAEGVRVVVVCATGGEEGDILNPRMDQPGIKKKMHELRRAELETACDILGVEQIYWLGYRDSGMPQTKGNDHPDAFCNADPEEAVGRLVSILRKERPEVVLSYDESRGYEHPDHVRIHEWGRQAFTAAAETGRFENAGEPWKPLKLYHFATFSRHRLQILSDAAIEAGLESPYAGFLENWDELGFDNPEVTTKVDVGEFVELRSKALLAHATQIDPDSFWFAIPDEMHRRVYPWEDYTLVEAAVEVELPEDDLFAGIANPPDSPDS